MRTRWVDYKNKEFDPSQIEPGWYVLARLRRGISEQD